MYVRGQRNRRFDSATIRKMMQKALRDKKMPVRSVIDTINHPWALTLIMTCPREMQKAADKISETAFTYLIQEFLHHNWSS